jgi:hypothetical protein
VPVVGGADRDGLDVLAVEDFVIVLVDLAFAFKTLGEVVGVAQVDVGTSDHVAQFGRLVADVGAATADSDGSHDEFVALGVIGPGRCAREDIGRGHARGSQAGGGFQEIATSALAPVHAKSPMQIRW